MLAGVTYAQKPRARDIGIPFSGTPGKYNAITDVARVEVGYSTMIRGSGKNHIGKGPVRTGVTAIFPNGMESINGKRAYGLPHDAVIRILKKYNVLK
ncbi:MAG: family peptidase [Mucilaginibacter sp.]|nr:family peptidase [Mucilaginibacter sp.]